MTSDKEGNVIKNHNFMEPLSKQLDTILPQFDSHADAVDKALPFYIALTAKMSGKTSEEFFGYAIKALEVIYGSSSEGKSTRELTESSYAYLTNVKAKEIFDKLTEAKL